MIKFCDVQRPRLGIFSDSSQPGARSNVGCVSARTDLRRKRRGGPVLPGSGAAPTSPFTAALAASGRGLHAVSGAPTPADG
jgi:hypothetical protein